MKLRIIALSVLIVTNSCKTKEKDYDATGTFEAVEIIISSQVNGPIQELSVREGDLLPPDKRVGLIDTTALYLKKREVKAKLVSIGSRLPNISKQTEYLNQKAKVAKTRLQHLKNERERMKNLVIANAATMKQLDDMEAQIEETIQQIQSIEKQHQSMISALTTQSKGIKSEIEPLKIRLQQIQDQMDRCKIINRTNGTVLTTYREQYEMATLGTPIYKIANLSTMYLRAYISGIQLQQIQLNDNVDVRIDDSKNAKEYKTYNGTISWISDKAEFTPKTIHTKEERENLVYAIKIRVVNDGYIKIGMYGEVLFH
ncbi:HlyD family secretion protein [Membranihabitans maritimus]|uniref:HlyD family secretion protein n=1 Tax=Membranihabitans maritimus TaxID=2904244 RepID=UPI001F197633|nr:HlyD family efflux transporter periplasmic adaptor subunit [Membranihabitans maritimus]